MEQKIIHKPRNLNAFIELKLCEVCETPYYRRTKKKRGSNQSGVRKVNAKTCSSKCSKIRTLKKQIENSRTWRKQLIIQNTKKGVMKNE